MMKIENLKLTQEWDKTFPKSEKVDHCKVSFVNRYGITLAADMYMPKNAEGRLPAVAVCGPFGAVKELLIIPGASHTDLYDGGGRDAIPFDKLQSFFEEYLK